MIDVWYNVILVVFPGLFVDRVMALSVYIYIYIHHISDSSVNNMAIAAAAVQRADFDSPVANLTSQDERVCCVA